MVSIIIQGEKTRKNNSLSDQKKERKKLSEVKLEGYFTKERGLVKYT